MWMWEYGIAHNAAMAFGLLIGLVLLGGIFYFAFTITPRDETNPKE